MVPAYIPTDHPEALALLARALKHNEDLDKVDGGLRHRPISEQLRTAICAIVCGIECRDWDPVAQGCILIMQVEGVMRQVEEKIDLDIRFKD
jgi:hypothetical protein